MAPQNTIHITFKYTLAFTLLTCSPLFADDTDIYGISQINVKPNVLILFDSSGSMDTRDVPAEIYDSSKSYPGTYTLNNLYQKHKKKWEVSDYNHYFNDSNNTFCPDAKKDLKTIGYWAGTLKDKGRCSSDGKLKDFRTGNYMNFAQSGGDQKKERMEVAKAAIAKLIDETGDSVRFGLMRFHNIEHGGKIVSECKDNNKDALIGADYDPTNPPKYTSYFDKNYGLIGQLAAEDWTPLSEALAEAGLYFAGQRAWFDTKSNNYIGKSPIQERCQQNYIIVMTDGEPTRDDDSNKFKQNYIFNKKVSEYGHDGKTNYLDDVAWILKNNDLRSDLPRDPEKTNFIDQTVTTYTIGFKTNQTLLENAAINGGGKYFTAQNASELSESLTSIIKSINAVNHNYSGASVPASQSNNIYSGQYVYYGLFQPTTDGNWYGNIKKYSYSKGEFYGKNGEKAIVNGKIVSDAVSYWSTEADSDNVLEGGVAARLKAHLAADGTRNIYTYAGKEPELSNPINSFTEVNTGLDSNVVSAVRREDPSNHPLGDFLHSLPKIVHYTGLGSVIFAGSNDGMLHAFDDTTGNELWAFIPPDLWSDLSALASTSNNKNYFVDGTPVFSTFANKTKKMLIFGERRGGTTYNALDITNRTAPRYLYSIRNDILSNEPLGQSWGTPQLIEIAQAPITNNGITTYPHQKVFLLPGGYDTNQDLEAPPTPDTKGRAIFAVNQQTGALIPNLAFTPDIDSLNGMTHSFVAVSGFPNPKNANQTSRIYAGDMGGNIWAFRDDIFSDKTKADDATEFDGLSDGTWEQKYKLHSVSGRKIFHEPNIAYEYIYTTVTDKTNSNLTKEVRRVGDYVYFGTGDREHPNSKSIDDRFYCIKNHWDKANLIEAYVDETDGGKIKNSKTNAEIDADNFYILDVTDNLLQNTESDPNTKKEYIAWTESALNNANNRGWFIRLVSDDGSLKGEKVVSAPTIYDGGVYFTTYVPIDDTTISNDDPCSSNTTTGTSYLYAIDYKNGTAINDYDKTNNPVGSEVISKSDRRQILSAGGIGTGSEISISEDGASLITGLNDEELEANPNLHRLYWRQMEKQ